MCWDTPFHEFSNYGLVKFPPSTVRIFRMVFNKLQLSDTFFKIIDTPKNACNTLHYGFNGKEEQNELGLQWQDFGFRNYDTAIGRFMNIDPMSEIPQSISYSPYNYAINNPIKFNDPDGMKWKDPSEAEDLKDDIKKTQAGLQKDIDRIQGKIDNKDLSDEAIARKEKRIANKKIRVERLDGAIDDIDALGADQTHTFDLVSGGELNYVRKGSDGIINIQGPNNSLHIHEIKHVALGLGSADGLKFGSTGLLKPALSANGMADEIQAYGVQWAYRPSSVPGSVGDGGNVNWTSLANLRSADGNFVYPALQMRYSNMKKQQRINKRMQRKRNRKNGKQ